MWTLVNPWTLHALKILSNAKGLATLALDENVLPSSHVTPSLSRVWRLLLGTRALPSAALPSPRRPPLVVRSESMRAYDISNLEIKTTKNTAMKFSSFCSFILRCIQCLVAVINVRNRKTTHKYRSLISPMTGKKNGSAALLF